VMRVTGRLVGGAVVVERAGLGRSAGVAATPARCVPLELAHEPSTSTTATETAAAT
jgi:hypothetical protein